MQATLLSLAISLSLIGCAAPAIQQGDGGTLPILARRDPPQAPTEAEPKKSDRINQVELAVSSDAFWLKYQTPLAAGNGRFAVRFFANDDDAYIGNLNYQLFGRPIVDIPLEISVGLGGYAGDIDKPNKNVFALALIGGARYEFPTSIPTRVATEVAYAPDILVGSSADRLLDFDVRVEGDVNSFATVFAGYRVFELDFGSRFEDKLDDAFQAGIRLVF